MVRFEHFKHFAARTAAAALSAVLLMTSGGAGNISAHALGRTPLGMVVTGNGGIVANYPELVKLLSTALLEHRETIDISSYGFTYSVENFTELIEEVRAAVPEAFFVKGFSCAIGGGDKMLKIVPIYNADLTASRSMLAEFEKACDHYLEIVKHDLPDGDDLSKALYLHDLLAFDFTYETFGDRDPNYGAYEVLVKKTGSCYCYSRAYVYLLGQLGIPSEIVSSDEMNHEWVKVKIGDRYYNVDLTWDDTAAVNGRGYTFFLLSDDRIRLTFPAGAHTGFSSITTSDTRFDMKRYHDFTVPICFADGKMYTVYDNALVRYDIDSDGMESLVDLSEYRWYIGGGPRYWIGCFSGVCSAGGRLFYNTPDEVFMYDPRENVSLSLMKRESGDAFYGMRAVGNKVYVVTRRDPTSAPNFTEIGDVCTVSFVTGTPEKVGRQVVISGDKLTQPPDPIREGYEFTGWKLGGKDYDFSEPVREDIVLRAGWRSLTPHLTEEDLAACAAAGVNIARSVRTDVICRLPI